MTDRHGYRPPSQRTHCIDMNIYLCVFVREESISHRWKDLLQQLQEQKVLLGNVVENLSVLRDVELVSQELKELQVSSL